MIITTSISAAIETLTQETGRWVTNTLPQVDGCIVFEFSSEQFQLAQKIVSGASLGPDLEGSVAFLVAREDRFHEEATGNEEANGYYGLGNNYCSSGWRFVRGEDVAEEGEEVSDTLYLWYETTRGTVLCHAVACNGQENFSIYLPKSREMGNHHYELARVKAGMTDEQYARWYNSHCLGNDKIPDYAEWAEFHNEKLVQLGFKPMVTGAQLALDRQIDSALKYVYGEWAQEYGIGPSLSALLGYGDSFFACEPRPGTPLTGKPRIEKATYVLRQLEEATLRWRSLVETWSSSGDLEDYEEDLEDYEDYEVNDEELDFDEE